MVYESSYESGLKPFQHDTQRGNWASPYDFLFTCIAHAFKMDIVVILPSLLFYDMGILSIVPYFFSLLVFVVPIVLIQSFLGQFSSSGLISVFRIAPLFKGMGYVGLAINLTTLTYYSVLAAIPLVFFFHSFRPTLPWSCEGSESWSNQENITTICNYDAAKDDNFTYILVHVPSINFFKSHLMDMDMETLADTNFAFSWSLLGCVLVVWTAAIYVVRQSTETIGKFIRYGVLTIVTILIICLIRFMFLPGALAGMEAFFFPTFDFESWMILTPLLATTAFGPGWGTILSMASYNKFKTNISLYSWIICLAQFAVMMLLALATFLVEFHFKEISTDYYYHNVENQWVAFLTIPSAIASMELPNLWSLIFFAMLVIGAFVLIIVQLLSVLTALFDEFEELRNKRREVIQALVAALAICSVFFCSNHGVFLFVILSKDIVITQTCMNLLLLVIVLWIYGRERFQRDIEFMTNQIFPTWKVYMLRICSTVIILFVLLIVMIIMIFEHSFYRSLIWTIGALVIALPWMVIPGYAIFVMLQTTGSLCMRFRRCVRPTDWYPADAEDRQKYEESMGNMEITHQLNEVVE